MRLSLIVQAIMGLLFLAAPITGYPITQKTMSELVLEELLDRFLLFSCWMLGDMPDHELPSQEAETRRGCEEEQRRITSKSRDPRLESLMRELSLPTHGYDGPSRARNAPRHHGDHRSTLLQKNYGAGTDTDTTTVTEKGDTTPPPPAESGPRRGNP
ncbi:hypothetical protein PVAG01_07920 [Phlyctema vagabunda]|uniref:Uncharacterized protein n=1 Tax=Phlyctema vagabunda TaxID=108571 RepID=A0ABR4PDX7_9HELO